MAEIQARLQSLSEEFTKLQQELQTAVQSRQKLEAQKQENSNVQKEFERLKNGENIYKLVGPVLLKQDKIEAESTVNGRLEFIGKELDRTDDQIKEMQGKIENKKGEIIQLQASLQGGSGAPGKVAAKG
ncbi:Prefoldin beta-like protein [Hypoxylon fragiforme]|uniref:Prefoldin beta-like protein n=1 Tax=Hypoxylon fragiforme TaxID=63214 RepID=UPI0020C677EF|nr:Prefoldin beta-like protein [Hypoxylon fragiforme]KAI2603326.1 Prefoldin beta-like protein [Hypoxylon fragiforme]